MSTRVTELVEEWESRPFEGGYRELQDLAAEDFSGVVRAGGAELYVTRGTVVGVRNGSIEDFESTDGTIYEAPTPALPLLGIMQDRGEEVRAQYYSEDTSIAEVDDKLEDGGFTGFVELSENVLSGDYYVVYHQGRSMSVAFVGNVGQLLEGEEAFERANDEVGIYTVHPVEIEPVDIPEPSTPDPDAETGAGAGAGAAAAGAESGEASEESADPDTDSDANQESTPETEEESETDTGETDTTEETRATDRVESEGETEQDTEQTTAPTAGTGETTTEAGGRTSEQPTPTDSGHPERTGDVDASEPRGEVESTESSRQDRRDVQSTGSERSSGRDRTRTSKTERTTGTADSRVAEPSAQSSEGSHDLETRSIPSLDPQRTESDDREPETREEGRTEMAGAGEQVAEPRGRSPDRDRDRAQEATAETDPPSESPSAGTTATAESGRESVDGRNVEKLRADLEDREAEIDRLEDELQTATEQREELEEELASVREERDELAEEVDRLTEQLDRLETELGAATDRERRITRQEALDGTDIFVRYGSKGDATLEKAHGGGTLQSDVVANLQLEKHTQFDADAVSVGGRTYDDFLDETVEYQFVRWVAEELLFEIRDTGHSDALKTLYDALPKIDRAELHGTVDVVYSEEGQETRSTESFDVVYRDRMGEPLLVANLNDSREAATESMMERLITAAERVGQTSDDFAAAFLVTESFFEPGALETADEATRGGLLSRSKQKSFVNLSRKRGYHLCLVEARSENFNLTVPEL